jgi:hypothetical protein
MIHPIKTLFLGLAIGLASCLVAHAQASFEVPQNVELKTKEDFPKYEAAIIGAAKWLEETDLDKEADKRQAVNGFLMQWLTGSPNVSIQIGEQLGKLYGSNIQLLTIYLASYARNILEGKGTATPTSATKAGLTSMLSVYKKGIAVEPNAEMEKLGKWVDDGKFDD